MPLSSTLLIDLVVITWFHSILNTFSLLIEMHFLYKSILQAAIYTSLYILILLHYFIVMTLRSTVRHQLIFPSPVHSRA